MGEWRPVAVAVGINMRRYRTQRGWTQEELGKRMGERPDAPPWSRQAVSAAEKGKRAFAVDEVATLADVFRVAIIDLITPVECECCGDKPPAGMTCQVCGAAGAPFGGEEES